VKKSCEIKGVGQKNGCNDVDANKFNNDIQGICIYLTVLEVHMPYIPLPVS